ncbi:MAG: hypothetical protein GY838_15315 [bacterium]|nr:hypothetical protein [bacterium]
MTRSRVVLSLAFVVLFVSSMALSGCCAWCKSKCVGTCCLPDLAVTAAEFDSVARTVSVTVKNIGSAGAGEFLVYFEINQVGAPASAKPESQHTESVVGLARGAEVSFDDIPLGSFSERPSIDLSTLMHGVLVVSADAKDMVTECDESNNVSEETF